MSAKLRSHKDLVKGDKNDQRVVFFFFRESKSVKIRIALQKGASGE